MLHELAQTDTTGVKQSTAPLFTRSDAMIGAAFIGATIALFPLDSKIAKELQDALADFKTSGKFIYSFVETGNESDYFYSVTADSIFMPREGLLELNGFGASAIKTPAVVAIPLPPLNFRKQV